MTTDAPRAVLTDDAPYCDSCGRQMIVRSHRRRGFDSETGEPHAAEMVWLCPRYDRQWRNLWLGGWTHYGYAIPHEDGPFKGPVFRLEWR